MTRSCEYCIVQYLTEVEGILKFYWDSLLIRCCVCWNGAVCAQIHTCRRWRRHLHCERCSCGRVGQWPVKFRPLPRWSDERTRQSEAHSNLLVTRVRLSILICYCSKVLCNSVKKSYCVCYHWVIPSTVILLGKFYDKYINKLMRFRYLMLLLCYSC